jgi:uncharacterized protein YjbI with pentapeptide repeats
MFKDYWKYDWVLPVYRYEGDLKNVPHGADLSGANLSGAVLREANLRWAIMIDTNLTQAYRHGA